MDTRELGEIDGKDMWKTISEDVKSPRTELLYNIDDVYNYGAIREGDWKYIYGSVNKGKFDDWYGASDEEYDYNVDEVLTSKTANTLTAFNTFQQIKEKYHLQNNTILLNKSKLLELRSSATVTCKEIHHNDDVTKCNPLESPCLFNLKDDPCERFNLAKINPMMVLNLEQNLIKMRSNVVPPRNVPRDPNADPVNWNNTWTNWVDYIELREENCSSESLSPIMIALIAFVCLLLIICSLIATGRFIRRPKRKTTNRESISFDIVESAKDCTDMALSKNYELSHIEHIKENGRTIE